MPHAHMLMTPAMQNTPFSQAEYMYVAKFLRQGNEKEGTLAQPQTEAWRDLLLLLLPHTPLPVPHAMPASLLPLEVGFEAADVDRSFPLLELGFRLSLFCANPKPRGEGEGVFERLLFSIELVAWL